MDDFQSNENSADQSKISLKNILLSICAEDAQALTLIFEGIFLYYIHFFPQSFML